MPKTAEYLCYTDGSCKAGDGAPGGWGYFVKAADGARLEAFGSAKGTHSKVMEHQAVAEALAVLPDGASVTVFSDNNALIESMSKQLERWRASGFAKVDPLIAELVRRISDCVVGKRLTVRWQWVRSHNGNEGNERADQLAGQGARQAKAELAAEKELRARR
jgi:ribonuclease HI